MEGSSCRSLRHSATTWARTGGAKLYLIAHVLGYASTDAASVYDEMVDRMTENLATFAEVMLEGWLRPEPIIRSSRSNKGHRRRRDIVQ